MAPEWQDQQPLFFLQMLFLLILKQHSCSRSLFSDFASILDAQRQSWSHLSWVRKATPHTQFSTQNYAVLPQQEGAARKWDRHMWLVLWKLRPWTKINPIPSSAIPGKLIIDKFRCLSILQNHFNKEAIYRSKSLENRLGNLNCIL